MLMNLPDDLQKEIGAYLDTVSLRFFALTNHRSLRNMRPYLIKRQQTLLRSPTISLTANRASLCYTSNAIYGCGSNDHGQLGLGHTTDCTAFTPLATLPGTLLQVVAGNYCTLVLTDQGLYGCGSNGSGELGPGHTTDCKTFTPFNNVPSELRQRQGLYRQLGKLIKLSETKELNFQHPEPLHPTTNLSHK